MTVGDFAARLRKSRRKVFKNGCEGYVGSCPGPRHSHGDASLSLACWTGDDNWVHLKCAGGCSEDEVLGAMGLSQDDRRPVEKISGDRPSAVYTYTDESGEYLFEKVRYDLGNGRKNFRVRSKLATGEYAHNLQHLNGQSKVLYNLPKVKEAVKAGATVYVNEGEKACDLFAKRGLVATCQPWGADEKNPASKWLPEHTKALQGAKEVVVIADRDETGLAYAKYIGDQLTDIVGAVKVVHAAVDTDKADAYDHFMAGLEPDSFVELNKPKSKKITLRSYTDVLEKPIDWLYAPYIERGNITILAGDPGIGKSFFSLALATAISHGEGPPGFVKRPPGDVVLCCTEDEAEQDIRPRLRGLGADVSHIFDVFDPETQDRLSPPITPEKMDIIIGLVQQLPNPQLVIFDPISEWFPATKNMNQANESREVMRLFRKLGKECNVSSLIVGHPNKNVGGQLLYRFQASIDFTAIVRSALYAAALPEGDKVVMHVKTNHAIRGKAIGYEIDETGQFLWTGLSDVNEDQLRQATNAAPITSKQKAAAYDWLIETLKKGPIDSKELFEGAKEAGYSKSTLFRAKEGKPDIRCIAVRNGPKITGWEWSINHETYYWQDKEDDPYAD